MTSSALLSIVALSSLFFVLLMFYIITAIVLFFIKLITRKKITGRQFGIALVIPLILIVIYGVFLVLSGGGR